MIDHVAIGVRDLASSKALYVSVLAPLGYVELTADEQTVGFGKAYPEFWLDSRPNAVIDPDPGLHICLRARDEAAVRAFHAAAVASGCTSDRDPGLYRVAGAMLFNAFIRDPDGNRIEAATFPKKPMS